VALTAGHKKCQNVRFEVLTAMSTKIQVSWNMMSSWLEIVTDTSKGPPASIFRLWAVQDLENRGSKLRRNISNYMPFTVVLYPWILSFRYNTK